MYSKVVTVIAVVSLSALFACNGQKGNADVTLKTKADSVAYAIGASIGGSMKKDGLEGLNLDILKDGLQTALKGDSLRFDQTQAQNIVQAYLTDKRKAKDAETLAAGQKFLAENKTKPGVIELPDGLQYQVITEGTGPKPKETDSVNVHYRGTLIDGTEFDSDKGRGTNHPVNRFIPGWTEALQMMKVGSKWKLYVPANLAYGERSMGPVITPNSTLIFDIELVGINGK